MPVSAAFAVPHPPIIHPEVGKGEEQRIAKTAQYFDECARLIAGIKPDTIILTSPHSAICYDYFHISPNKGASGDLAQFAAPGVVINAEYDEELVERITAKAKAHNIPAGTLGEQDPSLDHGTLIPLSFVNKHYEGYKLVRIGLSRLPLEVHYKFGNAIAEAVGDKNVVFIASGDLSHRVRADGPYGFAEEGVKFDEVVTGALGRGDFDALMHIDPVLEKKAAECGLRSFIIMAGALQNRKFTPKLWSYEGTFGIGYAVASFIVD